ncbi:MAG: ATP-dependent helicase [Cyanobacteria bacterium P01_E01_bin.6]
MVDQGSPHDEVSEETRFQNQEHLIQAGLIQADLAHASGVARHEQIAAWRRQLRPGQRQIADWNGGPLAVSAVPGAGKSTGMAIAAAILLAERFQQQVQAGKRSTPTQQLILVTFTRSAAANLRIKVRDYLRELSIPALGFAVYTLHSLALHIATRHPDRSHINLEQLSLVSPFQTHRLIRTCVEQWIVAHPDLYQRLLDGQQFDGEETERLRRQSVLRTEILPEVAQTAIHEAKSSGLSPDDLFHMHQTMARQSENSGDGAVSLEDGQGDDYDVLAIAAGLYQSYQLLLQQRGMIDYDDMILAALRVLDDPPTRQLWQSQIFAVFEDEAQDSSPLQTRLLELLAGGSSQVEESAPSESSTKARSTKAQHVDTDSFTAPMNLVRVGDPNQAINSTFTPADPLFFRDFCAACRQQGRLAEMTQAGRSTPIIMEAANATLTWVNEHYRFRESPFRSQVIQPVGEDDPQPDANPTPEGRGLELYTPDTPQHSIQMMVQRAAQLITRYPERSVAILVRENKQGTYIATQLKRGREKTEEDTHDTSQGIDLDALGIDVYDVGQRDRHSHIPSEMLPMLQFLNRPHSPDNLKTALKILMQRKLIPTQDLNELAAYPEQFLYPGPLEQPQVSFVAEARRYCASLLKARTELPHYQLIPFLALTLRYDPAELATADKLADTIARRTTTEQSLTSILMALGEIVRSEQFEPVDPDDEDTRYTRGGQITIITMHKAKGLDWDYVFIPFLQEHSIPGRVWVPPQRHFLGEISLAAIGRSHIRAGVHGQPALPSVTQAWEQAQQLKVAEEFRLLYVAMTRAKRLLWMAAETSSPFTWNKPDRLEERPPCPVFTMLKRWLAERKG